LRTPLERIKLKQGLLDSLESARRALVEEIKEADQMLDRSEDLVGIEQRVNTAVAKFNRECSTAVDTYLATSATAHFRA
jgi:hypothetical protein